jgi:GNAT superfamily N-acetyltransferase
VGRVDLVISTLAERPDLVPMINNFPDEGIAEFLYHDTVSTALFEPLSVIHPDLCVVAVDRSVPEVPVGKLVAMPFTWAGDPARELPAEGYDAVLLAAAADALAGRRGNLVSALLAIIAPGHRGQGLSARLLDAARRNAARLGYPALVAPVRPTRKHDHPGVPMAEYVSWTGPDGLPVDPWLRVHHRAGGRVVGVAPRSMTISADLDRWRAWTGLPFDAPGPVVVPGGLVPVVCDPTQNVATYVEPNVWVHHSLG